MLYNHGSQHGILTFFPVNKFFKKYYSHSSDDKDKFDDFTTALFLDGLITRNQRCKAPSVADWLQISSVKSAN